MFLNRRQIRILVQWIVLIIIRRNSSISLKYVIYRSVLVYNFFLVLMACVWSTLYIDRVSSIRQIFIWRILLLVFVFYLICQFDAWKIINWGHQVFGCFIGQLLYDSKINFTGVVLQNRLHLSQILLTLFCLTLKRLHG